MLKKLVEFRQVRYLISGGVGLLANLGLFSVLLNVLHETSYVASAIAAFCSFWVSYFMQKYFTFQKTSQVFHVKDITYFLLAALFNTGMISGFYGTFTHLVPPAVIPAKAGIHALFFQVLASGLAAVISYFIYKHLVFKQ